MMAQLLVLVSTAQQDRTDRMYSIYNVYVCTITCVNWS